MLYGFAAKFKLLPVQAKGPAGAFRTLRMHLCKEELWICSTARLCFSGILFVMKLQTCFIALPIAALISSCSDSSGGSSPSASRYVGNAPVLLNEVVPVNLDYEDETGEDPGYVELLNPADTAVNLQGLGLAASADSAQRWTFGNVVVPPHGRLVVFLSGRDQPNGVSPTDSMDLIGTGVWAWSDSQNKPAGRSTVKPYAFGGYLGKVDGKPALSAAITLAENSETGINWSSASVFLGLGTAQPSDVHDISDKNQIVLRGYIDAGKKLEMRLAQPDVDDWMGWAATVTGTGDSNGVYTISLPESDAIPDLHNIYGLRFASPNNQYTTLHFTLTSIVARKRGSELHSTLKLSKNGGSLFLVDSTGALRDTLTYPAVPLGLAYARNESDQTWNLQAPPTPGSENQGVVYNGVAEAPGSLPPSGLYEAPFAVTLPAASAGAELRCDTTGAMPTLQSPLQSGEIVFAATGVIRCAQFREGALPSAVTVRTYLVGERNPSLPVVSIVGDPGSFFDPDTGIYMDGPNPGTELPYYGANYWWDKELPVQVDFFEPGAKLAWTASAGFEIFGNYSRANPKKSGALVFRERYGQSRLNYAVFPDYPQVKSFKWIVLRNNGSNSQKDYLRDALMSSLTEGLGLDHQKNRSCIVYYNGEYFGIHQLRERSNEYYFESNYGYDPASIDLVKAMGEATAGTDGDYQNVMTWIASNSLSDDANLEWVKTRLDIDNFTNYVQSEIFFLNKDWPGNNLKRWRSRDPQTKWKWFLYDTDFGFGSIDQTADVNMFEFATEENGPDWPNPPASTFLLRSLFENAAYKQAFINRMNVLLATWYAPATVAARIDAMMAPIESEIPLDQERWTLSAGYMEDQLQAIRDFGAERAGQVQSDMDEFFGYTKWAPLTLEVVGKGSIAVEGLVLPGASVTFKAYTEVPIKVTAIDNRGGTFMGWSDGVSERERTLSVQAATTLQANFR